MYIYVISHIFVATHSEWGRKLHLRNVIKVYSTNGIRVVGSREKGTTGEGVSHGRESSRNYLMGESAQGESSGREGWPWEIPKAQAYYPWLQRGFYPRLCLFYSFVQKVHKNSTISSRTPVGM